MIKYLYEVIRSDINMKELDDDMQELYKFKERRGK